MSLCLCVGEVTAGPGGGDYYTDQSHDQGHRVLWIAPGATVSEGQPQTGAVLHGLLCW